ncbi:MAG: isocitrate/isopropylmalate dehydrogenase family protein [Betaproteobacteria bacterium]|nr:isocitrate/isopropylmalate dehydrogenase family protein [Betaproteobacteria bacterium]
MHQITLIPGDGIGPEVTRSAREIVTAAGANVTWETVGAGMRTGEECGTPLPANVFESIARTRLALKGPVQTPFGDAYPVVVEGRTHPSVTIALRKELKLFVNVRPARNYPGVKSRFDNVDLLIFRENSEDLYAGRERMVDADTAEAIKIITRQGSERVTRFACEYMRKIGRRKLSVIHKSNVMKLTDGLFLKTAQKVARDHPEFEVNERVIDALCMELVVRPEEFDSLLLPNLYGDIVSDLAAGLVGGLGVAPGANIGVDCAMFEAVHGAAPDIGGRDIANPMAMILSAVMLLRYIGDAQAADRIERALTAVLLDQKHVTRDLGGSAGTREMTAAIVDKLSKA